MYSAYLRAQTLELDSACFDIGHSYAHPSASYLRPVQLRHLFDPILDKDKGAGVKRSKHTQFLHNRPGDGFHILLHR